MGKVGLFLSIWAVTLSGESALAVSVPASEPLQYTFSFDQSFPSTGAGFTAAAVDAGGDVYFAGSTQVPLPTTPGVFQGVFAACAPITAPKGILLRPACSWAFVGQLSPDGTLLWLTYVPEPNGSSTIGQIAVDAAGSVYVSGSFQTVDGLPSAFPVTPGAFEVTPQGTGGVFLAKLNATGSKLVWATYFNNLNLVHTLDPDSSGNLYLGGSTEALVDLPLVHPLAGMAPSIESGYLAELNATGSGLLFGTWVNGPGARSGVNALTLDGSGNLYVTGGCSYSSPAADPCVPTTAGALQRSMKGLSTMYVMKLKPDGTLVFSTLLSGSNTQGAAGIATDGAGNVVVAGGVSSPGRQQPFDFPVTPAAFQTTNAKLNRATTPDTGFAAKLDASGSTLLYSTYFGGSSEDSITGLALDSQGNPVFSGYSDSPDLPMTPDAWQPCHPAPDFRFGNGVDADFIGKLTADGRSLSYASFFGPGNLLPNGQLGSSLTLFGVDASGDLFLLGSQQGIPVIVRYRITPRPLGAAGCVASATHGYESGVSPLGLIRIRGNGIAGTRSFAPALTSGGRLPLSYQGLEVFVGQTPAPLLAVEPNQITVVAPFGRQRRGAYRDLVRLPRPAATDGSTPIRVVQNGVLTAELDTPLQPVAPAAISTDGSGFGSAATLNQDGSTNSHDNPAAPGSVVSVFLTGLGLTNPPLQAGSMAPGSGSLQAGVQAVLGTVSSEIVYAGPAPGLLAGVYQINLRVPATGYVGWVPLALTAGAVQSQSDVGIYVSCPPGDTCTPFP
ncbi:MAG: hypothetical protein LAP40_28670 [Acidobacteriia bacterium]|nr:hypothetical protein [Terriglobia bacterium]